MLAKRKILRVAILFSVTASPRRTNTTVSGCKAVGDSFCLVIGPTSEFQLFKQD